MCHTCKLSSSTQLFTPGLTHQIINILYWTDVVVRADTRGQRFLLHLCNRGDR